MCRYELARFALKRFALCAFEPPRERKPVVYTAYEANAPDRRVWAAPAVDAEGVPYRGRKTDREAIREVRDRLHEQALADDLDAVSKRNEEEESDRSHAAER